MDQVDECFRANCRGDPQHNQFGEIDSLTGGDSDPVECRKNSCLLFLPRGLQKNFLSSRDSHQWNYDHRLIFRCAIMRVVQHAWKSWNYCMKFRMHRIRVQGQHHHSSWCGWHLKSFFYARRTCWYEECWECVTNESTGEKLISPAKMAVVLVRRLSLHSIS